MTKIELAEERKELLETAENALIDIKEKGACVWTQELEYALNKVSCEARENIEIIESL